MGRGNGWTRMRRGGCVRGIQIPMLRIEDFMNKLTDMDGGWWPFVFLRPPKNKGMDNALLLKLSLFFGTVIGILIVLDRIATTHRATVKVVGLALFLGWVIFFVLYKCTFAYCWNRRAKRLSDNEKKQMA